MRVIDPGHLYGLSRLDGDGEELLTFVKREGPGYPFNIGKHQGTNCQEVLRALIHRVRYLDRQISCPENAVIIESLRMAILQFERRAAARHGRELPPLPECIEEVPTCSHCGHIFCTVNEEKQ